MFAFKPWKALEFASRILLIAAILLNALAINPTPAQAEQESGSIRAGQLESRSIFNFPTFARPETRPGKSLEEQPKADPKEQTPALQDPASEFRTSTVFIENVGQFDPRARFQAQSGDITLHFAEDAIWMTLLEASEGNLKLNQDMFHGSSPQPVKDVKPQRGVNIKIHLVGANRHPKIQPIGELETNYSYFIGRSSTDWHADVPAWQGIRYKDIYPGLDLEISSESGQFGWQFIVTDQALFNGKNKQLLQNGIRIQINGHQKLELTQHKTKITTEVGPILLPEFRFNGRIIAPQLKNNDVIIPVAQPLSYLELTRSAAYLQGSEAESKTAPAKNVAMQTGGSASIPPLAPSETLLYATYLGGSVPRVSPVYSNPDANELGAGIAIAGDYVYIAGFSQSGDFPNAAGTFTVKFGETAFAQTYSPFRPFVAKLSTVTNQFVYVDYFNLGAQCPNPITGGTDFKTGAFHSLSVDSSGNVYVGGTTVNFVFPLTANARDTIISEQCWFSGNGSFLTLEGFIAKLDPSGTQLLYSSYFGGSSQETITSVENDESGNVYVVGNTFSNNLPAGGAIYDPSHNGGLDSFVTKINTISGQQSYFSYLGGNATDDPLGTTLSQDGSLYITGKTQSTNFTATSPGSSHTCFGCPEDGFVLKMLASGVVGYARYVGGTGGDVVTSLAVDPNNHAFVAGYTNSTDFPVTTSKTDTDVFVAELDTAGSFLYTTRFGGSGEEAWAWFGYDLGGAIGLDNEGNIYVVGGTISTDFPITLTAYDQARDQGPSNQDLFLTKINPETNQILYSTYVGGSSHEVTDTNLLMDSQNNVYILVTLTLSPDFPIKNGSPYKGDYDIAIAKLSTNVPVMPIDITLTYCPAECAVSSANADTSGLEGGPINTRTGSYDYSYIDLSLPTTAGTLSFERVYSSQAVLKYDLLGPGWTHNHDSRLIFPTDPLGVDGQVLLKARSANLYNFYDMGDGTYKAYPGIKATLTKVSTSPVRYELKDATDAKYLFDETGRLETYSDAQGHSWVYTYPSGKLHISAEDGKFLELSYDPQGRVASVRDQTERSVSYHYDTNGDLDSVLDVLDQNWTYMYDQTFDHFLTRVIAPGGVTVEETRYYTTGPNLGRAWQQYDGNGDLVVELIYNADGTTTVNNVLNDTSPETHIYDERGTLTTAQNAVGAELGKEYDFNFRPGIVTDALNNTTTLDWSDNGANLEYIKDALGGETFIDFEDPDIPNSPTKITDPMENETTFSYTHADFLTLPTRIAYPLLFPGDTTNIHTDYDYYPSTSGVFAGRIRQVTDPLLNKTFYEYQETATGHKEIVHTAYQTPKEQISEYEYDDLGRLIRVVDPTGVITYNEYDANGRLTRTIRNVQPTGFDPDTFVQNLVLNDGEDIYNIVTRYRYDLRGNQIAVIDTEWTITRTYYDLANRPIGVVQNLVINGNPAADDADVTAALTATPTLDDVPGYSLLYADRNIVTKTEYDDLGNSIVTRDPAGTITRTYYDEADRPKLVIQSWAGTDLYGNISTAPAYNPASPDQNVRTAYFYDDNGNVIASKDTLDVITRTYYDALNRPQVVIQNLFITGTDEDINADLQAVPTYDPDFPDRNLRTVTYYDDNGNVILTIDPKGIYTRTYYDALNRPTSVVQNLVGQTIIEATSSAATPPPAGISDTNIRTDTYYDKAGNVIASVDPRGTVTRTYFDEANRPVAVIQNLKISGIVDDIYVPLNQVPAYSPTFPDRNIRTLTTYNADGRRDTITDPLGHVTRYDYNEVGQLLKTTVNYINGGPPQYPADEWNIVTSYEYDALGRQVKTTDALNRVSLNTYDDLGRLSSLTQNYLQNQPQQNYKDAAGNRYNIITRYVYDARGNQFVVKTKADINEPEVVTRTYYDALNRPVTVVENFTGLITNSSPPDRGNPIDPLANLRIDTFYLGNGSIDVVRDELGKDTDYGYDALGRLISVIDPLSNPMNYAYDANSNRTLMTTFETPTKAVSTKYEYDDLNRLKVVIENNREDLLPFKDTKTNVRTEYTYDAGGNRLSIRDGQSFLEGRDYQTYFTYDALGHLKTEKDALNFDTKYDYNAIGSLTRQTDALGQRTCLYYDALNRLIGKHYRTDDNCPAAPTYDVSFDYDALGRRIDMDDGPNGFSQSTHWEYNNLDLPKLITDPFGTTVSYDYDALGNRTHLSYSSQAYVYKYDALNRLSEVTGNGLSNRVAYGYDASGNIKSVTRPNSLNSIYNYYDNGWLKDITHLAGTTTLASYQYQYYNNGNRKEVIENVLSPAVPPTVPPTATYTPTNTATETSTATNTATATATAAPLIQWNTFAGSATAVDAPTTIFVDGTGNSYVTGHSWAAWGSPIRSYQGGVDSFVAKFDANGNRLWHTFLGGTGNDYGYGIAVDGSGNIYITGDSYQTWGSPLTAYHGSGTSDAFVAKLNSSGTLLWNTFLGQASDDVSSSLVLDGSGNIYIGGYSFASWGTPVRPFQVGVDVFVAKLNSSGAVAWNTFLGGTSTDTGTHIALDANNNIFISGQSTGSWGTPINSFQIGPDAFVVRLNSSGILQWNTFLGGAGNDASKSISLDSFGNIYVGGGSGQTWGTPVRPHQGFNESFLAKLTSSGLFSWNTFLGSPGNDWDAYTATDSNGNVFVAGYSYQTWGTPVEAFHGSSDVFVTAINTTGNIYWHTFLGGVSSDEGGPLAWKNGNIYVGGTSSATWGQPVNPFTSADAFLAKLTSPVSATPTPTATATSTSTSTNTATATSTRTNTPSSTPSATPTFTQTPTASFTSTASHTPTVGPSDLIFADGFESGNLSAWTSSTTDNGDLSVSTAAAIIGSQGLQALIDDLNGIYVTDDSPSAEPRYRARFYFDPNSITMADKEAHFIFKAYQGTSTDILRVEFQRSSGVYQIRGGLLNDASSWVNTAWFPITDKDHSIEVDWQAATAAGANNGSLTLWLDGNQQPILNGVDNDTWRVDRARLGTLSGLDAGTSGIYYLDAFESRRTSYIGPVGQTPTLTPTFTATNTNTPSITPTFTKTNSPPATATFTPSLTFTATNTPQTPTVTPTPTFTPPGGGITYIVSKTNDTNDGTCDADCSLREAVRAANAHVGADVISIPAGTYNLTIAGTDDIASKGDLDLTDSVTLQGAGAGNTIIDATSVTDRIFHLPTASIIVVINDLTIQNGNRVGGSGGGINANAANSLTLNRVIVKNNAASESGGSGGSGGGIYLSAGSALIANNSAIVNNSAVDNVAGGAGGGIYFTGNSTIVLTNVTISGNSTNMHGAGIRGYTGGVSSLTNVTISGNTITNSTFDGNGGGVNFSSGATVSIKNVIIAGNTDLSGTTVRNDCSGSGISSLGHNLVGDNSACAITSVSGDLFGTSSSPVNAQLGPLQDNGGNTLTQALLMGSPAIDAGNSNGCPTTDQRGFSRDTNCDMGAYELGATGLAAFKYVNYVAAPAQQSGSLTFTPVDDAYIANDAPSTNYGSATTLQTDSSPIKDFLLKFTVSGVNGQSVSSAKIRLYNVDAATKGGDFYPVANNTWGQSTVTWNNAPAAGSTLLAALGAVSVNTWYEVDVTSFITGDGTYSLRISSKSSNGADYSSMEGANPPQLVITLGTATPIPTPTFTLTATPTFTPTITTTPPTQPTTPGALPDLTISQIKIEYQNTNCLLPNDSLGVRIWVTNSGTAGAGSFMVSVNGQQQTVSSLAVGESIAVFFPTSSNPVTAIVDVTNTIIESNESNNSTTQTVPVPTQPVPCTATPTPSTAVPPTATPITISYVYDPLNRLIEANYSNNDFYHYAYDAVGNRETLTSLVSGVSSNSSYLYDDANRLIRVNDVTYNWDNNGNLTNDGVNTYTYDNENRLETVTGAVTTSYFYNGLGDRLKQTVNETTTTFTMDLNAGLTQALSDGTHTYIYGNGRIAQVAGSGTEFFLGDALGSVRQLSNTSGSITYAKAYDPYGVVAFTSGASSTAYGYTGEYTTNDLVYLRARMYAPRIGRFLTHDTWTGDENLPMSYNRWLYTYAQPINNTDPSGLRTYNHLIFATFEDDYDPQRNKTAPQWTNQKMTNINFAVGTIAFAYANAYNAELVRRNLMEDCPPLELYIDPSTPNVDPFTAFFRVHGGKVKFKLNSFSVSGYWGRAISPREVWFFKNTPEDKLTSYVGQRFVTHEMGHVFENAYSEVYQQHTGTETEYKPARNLVALNDDLNNRFGFAGGFLDWQWSDDSSSGEIFADMFVGWIFNRWAPPPSVPLVDPRYRQQNEQYSYGLSKSEFMNEHMPTWIFETMQHRR